MFKSTMRQGYVMYSFSYICYTVTGQASRWCGGTGTAVIGHCRRATAKAERRCRTRRSVQCTRNRLTHASLVSLIGATNYATDQ